MSAAATPGPGEGRLRIWWNGESLQIETGSSLASLLAAMDRDPRTVAVEYNGAILPRGEYERTTLRGGDRLEVVEFVQGG